MALRRSLLRIDKAFLIETFGSLKIRYFGYTPSCLQLLRKSMSNFSYSFCFLLFHILSEETKSQVKAHLPYLANFYFCNYKPSLDGKLYNNPIEEIISGTSKFEKFNEDPTLKRKGSLQHF